MALIQQYFEIRDVRTNAVVASGSLFGRATWGRIMDDAHPVKVRIPAGTHLYDAASAAFGGPTFTAPPQTYLGRLSMDNGFSWDTAFWIEAGTVNFQPPCMDLDCEDVYAGTKNTYDDRSTFTDVPLLAAAFGQAGTVPLGNESGATQLALGGTMPNQKGIGRIIPGGANWAGRGLLTFTVLADPHVANAPVTVDINADSIHDGLLKLAQIAGSVFNPSDPAPYGSRQHLSIDTGAMTIAIGKVSATPALTFRLNDGTPVGLAEALIDGRTFQIRPMLTNMRGKVSLRGAASTHNLPDGARITGLVVVNTGHDTTSTNWFDSLPIISVATGNEGGGVFMYTHDGVFRRLSQVMDVWCLAVDKDANSLIAGTTYGVRTAPSGSIIQTTWPKVGPQDAESLAHTLSAKVVSLWVPLPNVIYALCDSSNGGAGVGVYRFPLLTGETDGGKNAGHMHWSRPGVSDIIFAAGNDDNLYLVDRSVPHRITRQINAADMPFVDTPDGAAVVGLDYIPELGRIFVRTATGAAGFYYLDLGSTSLVTANPGGTGPGGLADSAGPLSVLGVGYHNAARNGLNTQLLAITDRGAYWSGQTNGAGWQSMQAQNGLRDVQGAFIAGGKPQTVLNRVMTRLWLAGDSSFYESNSGGIWWEDVLAKQVDGIPFIAELHREIYGTLPDNTIGGLGNVTGASQAAGPVGSIVRVGSPIPTAPSVVNTGGSGQVLPIPKSNPRVLPNEMYYALRLTDRGDKTARIDHVTTVAPYAATEMGEESGIVADDSTPVNRASEQLMQLTFQEINQRTKPDIAVPLVYRWNDTDHSLRRLQTGDVVAVTATIQAPGPETVSTQVDWHAQLLYVLAVEHSTEQDGTQVRTTISAGTSMLISRQGLDALFNGLAYGVSRLVRRPGRRR